MCNKLLHWKFKRVQKHQTSEDTLYNKIRSTVSVHSPQRLQRVPQWHQPCRASTLTLAPSKRCSIPQRQCNQPCMDVLIETRQACLGHNMVPSTSGARPSGRRQRVRSVSEQVRSLNCNRHGLLCRRQHQSLLNVGGRYNVRLFKLIHCVLQDDRCLCLTTLVGTIKICVNNTHNTFFTISSRLAAVWRAQYCALEKCVGRVGDDSTALPNVWQRTSPTHTLIRMQDDHQHLTDGWCSRRQGVRWSDLQPLSDAHVTRHKSIIKLQGVLERDGPRLCLSHVVVVAALVLPC